MLGKKTQAALEFLTNYGWAMLLVILVIFGLVYFGLLNPDIFLPDKAELGLGISIIDASVNANSVSFVFQNSLGVPIYDFEITAKECNQVLDTYTKEIDMIAPGEKKIITIYCDETASVRSKYKSDIHASYKTRVRHSQIKMHHTKTGIIRYGVNDAISDVPIGLISHWGFENDVADEKGRNGGTEFDWEPSDEFPTYVAGISGNGIKLNGDGSGNGGNGVILSDSSSLDIENELTLMAWVKFSSFTNHGKIITKPYDDAVNTNPWELYSLDIKNTDDTNSHWAPCFLISTGVSGGMKAVCNNDWSLESDIWYHIAGVYDGKDMKLYIDGKLENRMESEIQIGTNNEPVFIGGVDNSDFASFHTYGVFDEIMILDISLSNSQIKEIICEQNPSGSYSFC